MASMPIGFEGLNDNAIFLLGKTGHGKSSTGNTILGRPAFHTSDGASSDTNITQSAWGRFNNETVKVVDGPGVCETRLSRGEAAKKMLEDMRVGLFLCPDGFDVMVLVLRYGIRFTQEELDTVRALKSCFGEDFLRDFGVILFTFGEQFELENKKRRDKITFPQWVGNQAGPLQEILRECEGRYVLFHNLDDDKREEDVSALLNMAKALRRRGRRYTQDLFNRVKVEHEKFYARENATELKEKMQRRIDLLQDSLARVITMDDRCDAQTVMTELDQLLEDVWLLKMEIQNEDKQTGVLKALMHTAQLLETTIKNNKDRIMERQTAVAAQMEREDMIESLTNMQHQLDDLRAANTPGPASSGFVDTLKSIGKVMLGVAGVLGGAFAAARGQVGVGMALVQGGVRALTFSNDD